MFHSVERFIAIKYPLKYHNRYTFSHIKILNMDYFYSGPGRVRRLKFMALAATWMIGCVFASIPFIIDCLQDENSNNQAYDIQVANVQCSHYSLFSCQTSMLSDGTLIVITISALIPLAMVWAVNIWLYIRKGSFYSQFGHFMRNVA